MGTFILPLLLLALLHLTEQQTPCIPKSYDKNKIVCVCNSTYCDELPKIKPPPQGQYFLYTSSSTGLRFNRKQGEFQKEVQLNKSNIPVIINTDNTCQSILGWGGAFTDSTGINIKSLAPQASENLLRSYFSEGGLEYSLCRVPIGGTDFSTHGYSYNDGDEDTELTNFKLAPEDHEYKIPFIKQAKQLYSNLKLFASAWTAPKWMKHNGKYTGPDILKKSTYQSWADYFLKFLKSYKNEGIDFWGITTGNEPSMGLIPAKINSVGWLPWQMSRWIGENLGPTIRNSEFKDIKIIGVDDQIFYFPYIINIIFGNNKSEQYIDGFGLHWYWRNIFSYSQLTKTHELYPNKFILATEACEGSETFQEAVIMGDWNRAESYAKDIINDLNNWVEGWIDWNMALDVTGGPTYINNNVDSPIIVNATSGEFYKQPMYYALGHFSKFIPEGSKRISIQQSNEMEFTAFLRPDNAVTIVVLNEGDQDILIQIKDNKINGGIQETLPAHSISTFVY